MKSATRFLLGALVLVVAAGVVAVLRRPTVAVEPIEPAPSTSSTIAPAELSPFPVGEGPASADTRESATKPVSSSLPVGSESVADAALHVDEQRYPGGNLKSRVSVDAKGLRQGLAEGWYDNGQLWDKGWFVDGQKQGEWTSYFQNGRVRDSVVYKDGEMNGLLTQWYDSGRLAKEKMMVLGRGHGHCRTWHANGVLESEGDFRDGMREGRWSYWHEDQSVDGEKSGTYEHDKRVGD